MDKLIEIEREGQRVLTTQQLAECYGTDSKTINYNFSYNKERYIEGRHYFYLVGEALKQFKSYIGNSSVALGINKYAKHLYLWTEMGTLHHAKSLGTDKAWDVFIMLEKTYFWAKDMAKSAASGADEDKLGGIQSMVSTTQQQVEGIRLEVQGIRDAIQIHPEDWRRDTNKIIAGVCKKTGDFAGIKPDIYKALEERARCRLDVRLNNLKGRAAAKGMAPSRIKALNKVDAITDDVRLKEIYVTIVKELGVKYSISG